MCLCERSFYFYLAVSLSLQEKNLQVIYNAVRDKSSNVIVHCIGKETFFKRNVCVANGLGIFYESR